MAEIEPVPELDTRFGDPDATPRPWAEVVEVLRSSEMFWLSTVRRDGRPHVTPLPAIWLDGLLHFCTGPGEQKVKNLAANPHCVLTTGTNQFRSGLDVVVEGAAAQVTDQALLRRLATAWRSKLDWAFEVVDGGFREPGFDTTALVFGVAPVKVLGFGKGSPYSQTRYRFGGERWRTGRPGPLPPRPAAVDGPAVVTGRIGGARPSMPCLPAQPAIISQVGG